MSQPNFGRNPLARLIPIAVGVVILLVVVAIESASKHRRMAQC